MRDTTLQYKRARTLAQPNTIDPAIGEVGVIMFQEDGYTCIEFIYTEPEWHYARAYYLDTEYEILADEV